MINAAIRKIFGSKNERVIRALMPQVERINELEPELQKLSDDQLRDKTVEFRARLAKGETLDELLPEAFATVREAAKRVLGQRHYDVQLIGGMVLHSGRIAEMKTGEGKTLVATLPVYLNALEGKGVHVVTVNDYLAKRDSEWMGRIYGFLGMTTGCIVHDLSNEERQKNYGCDITYGTNNEFGFDYLRDNMKYSVEAMVQRHLRFAIVDEVDSILIDEARTPLIISGPTEDSTDKYYVVNQVIPRLKRDQDYTLDEEHKSVTLTDDGVQRAEKLLGVGNLFDAQNIEILHHVNQALRAHTLYKKDVEYVVKEGEVIIVDEFTGRLMPGRRWSDGLHQAVEAKEGVTIENENQTLATITFQNYFKMYDKLAGMTGTADTEAGEFHEIYKLEVIVIPTNRNMQRLDHPDVVYKGEKGKFRAVVRELEELYAKKQPVLVGTVSIEKSEKLSELLRKKGIPHTVLNAKFHEKEAEIVSQAGRSGAVTLSTNMAGRGTDIMLGGNPEMLAKHEVKNPDENPEAYQEALARHRAECEADKERVLAAGGLAIIGTERHESRRIDNQLRGRAGRQGDPGQSRFYLSLEDDLLRIFGADRITGLMERLGMEEDEPIEHGLVTRAIENAQKKVENRNFDIRKHLLEYDQVMNDQRRAIYAERRRVLAGEGLREMFDQILDNVIEEIVEAFAQDKVPGSEWEWRAIDEDMQTQFGFTLGLSDDEKDGLIPASFGDLLAERVGAHLDAKEKEFGEANYLDILRHVLITTLDSLWKDHLLAMDHLREGINLRAYGQKDPKQEYKREGHTMFQEMVAVFRSDVVQKMSVVQIRRDVPLPQPQGAPAPAPLQQAPQRPLPPPPMLPSAPLPNEKKMTFSHGDAPVKEAKKEPIKTGHKVGRNEPCPCGSGKKFKVCHGAAG
jgi:preprotein translocase subunit SecA